VRDYTSAPAEGETSPLAGLSFRLDGVEFSCQGDLSILEVAELARVSVSGGDMEEAAKLGLIAEQFRAAFDTANSVLLTILADINTEVQNAVERAAGRPTMPPSPSGTGAPDPDDRTSRIISMQTGDVTVIPLAGKADAQVEPATVTGAARRPPQDRQQKRRRTG